MSSTPKDKSAESTRGDHPLPSPRAFGLGDLIALTIWTVALGLFFRDVLLFRGALFYFDITEINLPYRDFFADELKAGRFSMWFPGLHCGMPLYSESQAGYLHPLKYLFYPWLETWQAFGLDTVASVWLTGLATYGWLRRHVGAVGALTGASLFGLSGFVWAHLIHTSMINALISVPLAFWALECCWDGGRLRGIALGGLAMASQVFAGHLQDFLLTGIGLLLYGLYRSVTERGIGKRLFGIGAASGIICLGVLLSAIQWIPSKELLDRSPRAEGLTWEELTYGSWHPELLPTLLVREAYGTRARDTDWMDGFYPYHEMNTYMGILGLGLAVLGFVGRLDRWVAFWILFGSVGGLLMLGRYTALMDYAQEIPVIGSSRIPVRFHLWVSMAVAALAAVGVDRLARQGDLRLRPALVVIAALVVLSLPILFLVYGPVWQEPDRWPREYHQLRYQWLGSEFIIASLRGVLLAVIGSICVVIAKRTQGTRRTIAASMLPGLIIVELLSAHGEDVPTVDPSYWTEPPPSAVVIASDPTHGRVFGLGRFSAGEPGYASVPIDFPASRDTLAWSLAPVFELRSLMGATPMIPTRWKQFMDATATSDARFAISATTHALTGYPGQFPGWEPPEKLGTAYVHRIPDPELRVRLMGQPVYAADQREAVRLLRRLGPEIRDRLVVEDPNRPLDPNTIATGSATIVEELPDFLRIRTESTGASYLVVADGFDPGWSATIDGEPAAIHPAFVHFRALYLPEGRHEVVFHYLPAGFKLGSLITAAGVLLFLGFLLYPRRIAELDPTHKRLQWPQWWPSVPIGIAILVVALSALKVGSDGLSLHPRWEGSWHTFTWGAGLEAMQREPIVPDQ